MSHTDEGGIPISSQSTFERKPIPPRSPTSIMWFQR